MANYELPQVRVFQDLEPSIEPSERAMLPVIIGQRRDIFEYDPDSQDSSKTGLLGSYTMSEDLYADWADLGANSTVIENTVRIYGEDLRVSLVKSGYLPDVYTLTPTHEDFGSTLIDTEKFFTPIIDGQENALVFANIVAGEVDPSINLSGNDLYRTPQVGDYIKVRQTSQDSAQDEDWTAQVIGLIETETARSNGGVGTPEENEANVFETSEQASTLAASSPVAGDVYLGVDFRVVPLYEIADDNDTSWLAKYKEISLNKACEEGIFNLADLGYKIRIHNASSGLLSECTVDVSVQSVEKNTLIEDIPLDSFLLTDDNINDRLWFDDGSVSTKGGILGTYTPVDATDPIGGIIVDDLFVVYAVPKESEFIFSEAERTDNVVTLTQDSNTNAAVAGVRPYDVGDYIIVTGLTDVTGPIDVSDMNGRYQITAATDGTISFDNEGIDVAQLDILVPLNVSVFLTPVKNDNFEISGSVTRPGQVYDGVSSNVPNIETAEYDSEDDTIYSIEVVEGGAWDVSSNGVDTFFPDLALRISTNNGVDPVEIVRPVIDWDPEAESGTGVTDNIRVGTKGIELSFSPTVDGSSTIIAFAKGDVWTLEATGRSGDVIVGVITDKDFDYFDSAYEEQRLDIEFTQELEGQTEIPRVQLDSVENWEINPDEAPDENFYDLKVAALSQVPISDLDAELNISEGEIYMSYEAVNNTNTGSIMTILDASDPDGEIGPDDLRNPLGYGVRKALLNSQGVPVLAVSVDEMADEDIDDALAIISNNNNAYQITPMTFDESIQNKVVAHCLAMSTELMDLWRRAYISTDIGDEYGLLTVDANNDSILATFEANDDNDAYNKLVLDPSVVGVSFLDSNVKAGQTVRYEFGEDMYGNETYKEFTVLSVLNATELLILGDYGLASETIQIKIYKDTSAEDVIYEVGNRSEGLNSRRVTNVFPPVAVDDNDQAVPGYFVAAALAGLAAGSEPHQGHTNSKLLGFSEASNLAPMRRMTVIDLNNLAGAGVTIITGEASDIGVRHELTTAMIDRKNRETMVTRNLDSLSYAYYDALSPFIGIANVTPEFVQKIRTELTSIGNFLISSTKRPLIGSQMTSFTIDSVEQDPVLADKVNIYISPVLPLPFNYGDIHLQI